MQWLLLVDSAQGNKQANISEFYNNIDYSIKQHRNLALPFFLTTLHGQIS